MKRKYGEYPDLISALRDYSEGPSGFWGSVCDEAADEIERLRERLEEATKLIAAALAEIEATLAYEGQTYGPDPEIHRLLSAFLRAPDSATTGHTPEEDK